MSTTDTTTHDYTTGVPRHHHSLCLEDGNFVMRVENAIFNVHRSVLERYSNVIKDMLDVPQGNEFAGGTDEHPLVLTGDSVVGWELLLGAQYDGPSFLDPDVITGAQALTILPIAHKYCMDGAEKALLKRLEPGSNTEENVNLLVAAQIVGSEPLYKQALDALIASDEKPDIAQANRIGTEALHAIMTASLVAANAVLASVDNRQCLHCSFVTNWRCGFCSRYQGQQGEEEA